MGGKKKKSQVTKEESSVVCVFLSGTTTTTVVVETCINIDWFLLPERVSGESTFALFHYLVEQLSSDWRQTDGQTDGETRKRAATARLN